MRISAESLRNGDHFPLQIGDVEVLLNGNLVEKTIDADSEEGWVQFYVTPLTIDEVDGDSFKILTLYGQVEFVFREKSK